MKLLWVKAGGLVPADTGGKIRSLSLARELAKRHDVTLFTFYARHADDVHASLDRVFFRAICVPVDLPARRGVRDCLLYCRLFLSGRPYTMDKYYRRSVRVEMNRILRSESFDLVLCDFVHPAGILDWSIKPPKVLFTHNVESRIWKRYCEVASNPLWKLTAYAECKALERAERKYVSLADHVLTVSEVDRSFFSRFVEPSRITSISTGVDTEYFQPAPEKEVAETIVFTGSMDWMPNEDGVLWFAGEVLPRIHRQLPHAALWVVGRNPTARVRSLASREPRIQVTGRVEDVRPFLHQGAVYAVPLRSGSGTRLKIFEAMAAGKAVVSTFLGAEGLPVRDGSEILLADDADRMAGNIIELLRDRDKRRRLGASARALVESRYSWPSVAAELERVLLRACEKGDGSKVRRAETGA